MDHPISSKLEIVIPAYRWHSQSFLHALDGISDEDSLVRVSGVTNHIIWVAGNFVNMRYSLAWMLGIREEDPNSDLFFQGKALDESYQYPSLKELKQNFHHISSLVYQKLLVTTDEELAVVFPMGIDVSFYEENILNFVGMCIGREDYLTGQIALMRKILEYPPMKYDVDENLKY